MSKEEIVVDLDDADAADVADGDEKKETKRSNDDVRDEEEEEEEEEEEQEKLGENEYADINMELLRALGIVGTNFQPMKKKPVAKKPKKVKPERSQPSRRTPRNVSQRNLSDLALAKFCSYCRVQGHSINNCLASKLDRKEAVGARRSERSRRFKQIEEESSEGGLPAPDADGWD